MNNAEREARNNARRRSPLDESVFIRGRLFREDRSSFERYRDLTLHSFSWPKLIRYEFLTLFIGPIPGALGLVLRKRLFPGLFRKTGKNCIFGPNLTLRHADRITLGDGVILDRDCLLDARGAGDAGIVIGDRVIVSHGAAIQAKVGHIKIGADCNIGSHVDIVAQGSIVIADNVSIAGNAMIAGGRYVVELEGAGRERFTSGSICLGRNVRIGMGAIVQDGVRIGDDAIVAPGSVVFESVAAESVVWGNPARPVRNRRQPRDTRPAEPLEEPHPRGNGDGTEAGRVRQQICDYLREDLFIEFGPDDYGTADSLIDDGVLDSLGLVRLALWIERHFGVEIDLASLDASEIESVDRIAAYVDQRAG
jgi:acetyltransferase-like isoleucine patch superfamily enzyme/acyl carrier protein